MRKILYICLALLTLPSYASESDDWYIGALYNSQKISISGRDFNALGMIAGYQYNKYLALETRVSVGTEGYSSFYGTPDSREGEYKEDIDTQASLFIKASYPILESVNIYGLAGYSNTKLEIRGLGQVNDSNSNIIGNYPFKITETKSGFSYGFGLTYKINEQFNIFIDYQVLPDFEPNSNFSKSWKSTSVGINYFF